MPADPPAAYSWLPYALGSALFAALTAILGKVGVAEVNSNFATVVRTAVILLVTAAIVTARAEWEPWAKLTGRGVLFLVLSGLATGASWLCYYRALQLGPASRVAPVDKLSVVLVVALAALVLGETVSWQAAAGAVLIAAGVVLVALA